MDFFTGNSNLNPASWSANWKTNEPAISPQLQQVYALSSQLGNLASGGGTFPQQSVNTVPAGGGVVQTPQVFGGEAVSMSDRKNQQPVQTAQNVAGSAAEQNLAAIPQLTQLSGIINDLNRTQNQNRIPGGAALEAQSSANIANQLAGNLPQSFLENLHATLATRQSAGGFGVDSANLNAAALRAMGLESGQLQQLGQQNLTSAYNRAAPLWDVSQMMITPQIAQQQAEAAQQESQFARNLQQQRESLAQEMGFNYAQLGQQQQQFVDSQALQREQMANEMGYNYAQLNQQQKQFVDSQALQREQAANQLGLSYAQLNQQQKQFVDEMAQRQNETQGQLGLSYAQLGQQGSQFAQSLQQQKEELAAQMGLSYAQLNQGQKQFVDEMAQRNAQQNQNYALAIAQLQAQLAKDQQAYALAAQEAQNQAAVQQAALNQNQAQFNYATPPWQLVR